MRRPVSRDFAAAIVLAIVWFSGITYLHSHGWDNIGPQTYRSYWIAGICSVAVLLTRQTWPKATLAVVVLTYPGLFNTWLATDFHLLPYLFAGYTVAATGSLRTIVILPVTEFAVIFALIPPRDFLRMIAGQEGIAHWNFSRVITLTALVAAAIFVGRASYLQKRANIVLRQRHLELERLRRIETDQVVTAERTRIARELHDVVAHHISAVVIRAQAADRVADSRPGETRAAVRWIAANGQETLAAMRHVVRVLRSTETGGSLTPQATLSELPQIAERMSAVGLAVELRLPPILPVLPAPVELATVRIIQEALTNVLVHAHASQALVELELLPGDQIRLSVQDDGSAGGPPTVPVRLLVAGQPLTAPAPPAAPRPKRASAPALGGNGLVGMRERAASCGGALTIGVSPLGGWLVTAVLAAKLEPGLLPAPEPVPLPAAAPPPAAATPVPASTPPPMAPSATAGPAYAVGPEPSAG